MDENCMNTPNCLNFQMKEYVHITLGTCALLNAYQIFHDFYTDRHTHTHTSHIQTHTHTHIHTHTQTYKLMV